jgi:hypothetical protein
MYPSLLFNITSNSSSETTTSVTGAGEVSEEEDKHTQAEAIIETLVKVGNKLIPAMNAIIDADISNKLNTIIDNTDIINSNIQVIANNL